MKIWASHNEQEGLFLIYRALQEHLAKGEQAWLVVPEQFTMQSDINLLSALQAEAVFDVAVQSFSSLAYWTLDQVPSTSKKPLTDIGKKLLMRQILEEHHHDLQYFQGDRGTSNDIITPLVNALTEFRQHCIAPKELERFSSQSEDALYAHKLKDLAQLLQWYEEAIEPFFLDTEARLRSFIQALPEVVDALPKHLYFIHFYGLNALEIDILETLEQLGIHLTFFLCMPEEWLTRSFPPHDLGAFEATWRLYDQLKKREGINLSFSLQHIKSDHETEQIARRLFLRKSSPSEEDKVLFPIVEAKTIEEEVHWLATTIRQNIQKGDARYKDIVVVATNREAYFLHIQNIFPTYGIPFFLDARKPLSQHPMVRHILLFFDMWQQGIKLAKLTSYLRDHYIPLEDSCVFGFERWAKSRRLHHTMFFDPQYFALYTEVQSEKLPTSAELDTVYAAYHVHRYLKDVVGPQFQSLSEVSSVSDFIHWFSQFMNEKDFLKQRIDDVQHDKDTYAQIFSIFSSVFEQMQRLLDEKTIEASLLVQLFVDGIQEQTLGVVPPYQDEVLIGDLQRARFSAKPYQFVMGMSDQYYPFYHTSGGILQEHELDKLSAEGVVLSHCKSNYVANEKLALYRLLSHVDSKTFLSYALEAETGESMRPSFYIQKLRGLQSNASIETASSKLWNAKSYSPFMALQYVAESIKENKNEDIYMSYLKAFQRKNPSLFLSLQAGLTINHEKDALSPMVATQLYPRLTRRFKVSASELENMALCPYRHFVRYGLRPEEQPSYDLERYEVGNLFHDTMHEVTKTFSHTPIDDLSEEKLQESVTTSFVQSQEKHLLPYRRKSARNQFFLQASQAQAMEVSKQIIRQLQQGDFVVLGEEIAFENKKDARFPALALHAQGKTFYLEGRIDRIDVGSIDGASWLRVVDYKTGTRHFDLTRVLEGADLQLVLYLKAVTNATGYHPAGSFYLTLQRKVLSEDTQELHENLDKHFRMEGFLTNHKEVIKAMDKNAFESPIVMSFKGRKKDLLEKENVLDDVLMEGLLNKSIEVAEYLLARILEGDVSVKPKKIADRLPCTYCLYSGICKIDDAFLQTLPEAEAVSWEIWKKDLQKGEA